MKNRDIRCQGGKGVDLSGYVQPRKKYQLPYRCYDNVSGRIDYVFTSIDYFLDTMYYSLYKYFFSLEIARINPRTGFLLFGLRILWNTGSVLRNPN